MRSGGTTSMTADQINERMEFLAGSVSPTSLSIHMRHVDEGLKIWLDILTNPAFPEDRIQREKEAMAAPLRNRNRNLTGVASTHLGEADLRRGLARSRPRRPRRPSTASRETTSWRGTRSTGARTTPSSSSPATSRRPRCCRSSRRRSASGATAEAKATPAVAEGRGRRGQARRLHGAAARRDAEPGHHPDRHARPDAGRPRLPGRRPDELHARRRVVLVAHHQGRAHRQRAGVHARARASAPASTTRGRSPASRRRRTRPSSSRRSS